MGRRDWMETRAQVESLVWPQGRAVPPWRCKGSWCVGRCMRSYGGGSGSVRIWAFSSTGFSFLSEGRRQVIISKCRRGTLAGWRGKKYCMIYTLSAVAPLIPMGYQLPGVPTAPSAMSSAAESYLTQGHTPPSSSQPVSI